MASRKPIGVFDSGVSGLSILRALRRELPQEDFVYFSDAGHGPYGQRSDSFVIDRSRAIARQLLDEHRVKSLVVACNTATAAAVHLLRAEFDHLPVIGLEPALKPAASVSRTGRVAVFATRSTLSSMKFRALHGLRQHQAEFVLRRAKVSRRRSKRMITRRFALSASGMYARPERSGTARARLTPWCWGARTTRSPAVSLKRLSARVFGFLKPVHRWRGRPEECWRPAASSMRQERRR